MSTKLFAADYIAPTINVVGAGLFALGGLLLKRFLDRRDGGVSASNEVAVVTALAKEVAALEAENEKLRDAADRKETDQ